MKFINHLTKEEITGLPSRHLVSYVISEVINRHLYIKNGEDVRYYLVTGHVYSNPDYYVLYELTKNQYDKKMLIHELLI